MRLEINKIAWRSIRNLKFVLIATNKVEKDRLKAN